jgi:hypothetical protein
MDRDELGFVGAAIMGISRYGGGQISYGMMQAGGSQDQLSIPFTTTFPTDQNPISQGSIWVNGQDTGIAWNNVKTLGGNAVGVVDIGVQRYADDIAHLKKSALTFANDQYAQATLYVASGYTGNGGSHECELLLRFEITANNARGYEIIYGMYGPGLPGAQGYIAVVRWEGAYGIFTPLYDSGQTLPIPVDGDIIKAEIIGTSINVYKNGSLFVGPVATGGTFTEGQPGVGFWPADNAQHDNMGWKDYTAGNS